MAPPQTSRIIDGVITDAKDADADQSPSPHDLAALFQLRNLCDLLETYLEPAQIDHIHRAYLFGAKAHTGQFRRSGEPYICHPIAVAHILAEMHMDPCSLSAALLHDVIEDTGASKEELALEFGEEVAEMVDGVSKLTQMELDNPDHAQAENFRKMMMAMVRDIRVILIKLADRLHNMRTLSAMSPQKRRRIARETLDIFVPIANRLGMNAIRLELEDLGFASLYPMRYRVIKEAVRKARGNRREIMGRIESSIKQRTLEAAFTGRVMGREKHLYSIYRKMEHKGLSLSEILDVYALRIIVDSVDSCYRMLGVIHGIYTPLPGRFKDYIAIPKSNGYQSLHTVLFGPYGVPIEVQIRTEEMDQVAEAGVAAHWFYKSGADSDNSAHARAREWLRSLLEMQKYSGSSVEFLENVKIDLFPNEVYVFTPRGDIMELPRGATSVDFAYAVHTDIGNTCAAAKINRRMMPLSTPLENGQTVQVITSPVARPNPAWLNFVKTAKARTNIRNFLKNLTRFDAIKLGRHLLESALSSIDAQLEQFDPETIDDTLKGLGVVSLDELCEQLGMGQRLAVLVARHFAPETAEGDAPQSPRTTVPLEIKGSEGSAVSYAKCCMPIPGDAIIGFMSAGKGLVIHRHTCRNVGEFRKTPEKWVNVEWQEGIESSFATEIHVETDSQRGALATVAAELSELDSNIEDVEIKERGDDYTTIMFVITVRNRMHLAKIIRRIRIIRMVRRIVRI